MAALWAALGLALPEAQLAVLGLALPEASLAALGLAVQGSASLAAAARPSVSRSQRRWLRLWLSHQRPSHQRPSHQRPLVAGPALQPVAGPVLQPSVAGPVVQAVAGPVLQAVAGPPLHAGLSHQRPSLALSKACPASACSLPEASSSSPMPLTLWGHDQLLQQLWRELHEQLEHVPHVVPQELLQQLEHVPHVQLELRVPQELLQQLWQVLHEPL